MPVISQSLVNFVKNPLLASGALGALAGLNKAKAIDNTAFLNHLADIKSSNKMYIPFADLGFKLEEAINPTNAKKVYTALKDKVGAIDKFTMIPHADAGSSGVMELIPTDEACLEVAKRMPKKDLIKSIYAPAIASSAGTAVAATAATMYGPKLYNKLKDKIKENSATKEASECVLNEIQKRAEEGIFSEICGNENIDDLLTKYSSLH